jgi:hypothetical protein
MIEEPGARIFPEPEGAALLDDKVLDARAGSGGVHAADQADA